MYRCPLRKESSSIPIRVSPSSGSPCRTRSSATTRSMIRPTVYQLIRISSHTAVFEQCVASHATCCSNALLKRLPCRAHATRATTTPWRRHSTRGASASMNALRRPEIERPPTAGSFPTVIAARPAAAHPTTRSVPPPRTDPHHDRVLLDQHRLDHRALHTHKPRQYPVLAHAATCLPREPTFDSRNPRNRAACAYKSTHGNLGPPFFGGYVSGLVGAMVMTPVAYFLARRPGSMPAYATFLPGFWLLVPGAIGLIGVTTLAGSGTATASNDFKTAVGSTIAVALGVLCGTQLHESLAATTTRLGRARRH